ncbi:amino acid/polyamine transporter I [Aspergillus granulosus]|uniref:Amino acid/polyamine transporter I n=1 Tax=Aspergillus granulosus TaxID=176169 RepID=A0ABR4H0Z0_9EURO
MNPPTTGKPLQAMDAPSKSGSLLEDGTIEELGYIPAYRRVFRSLGNMCMVISLTSPLGAIMVSGFYQITYGGYWGLSWGWIIPNLILLPQVLAIAELASSMPVNGSFYWWAGALAPPQWSHAVAFITGCLSMLTMLTSTASFAYAVATSLSYSVKIAVPTIVWTDAQLMGLSLGVIIIWMGIMCMKLENISTVYILMAIILLLQSLAFIFGLPISHAVQNRPFTPPGVVFGEYTTYTDWGLAVSVPYCWFGALWVNSSWMASVYVSEETQNAGTEIPKSIFYTFAVTAVAGLLCCLLCAFCITDIDAAATDITGMPLFNLVVSHWGRTASAAFFLAAMPVALIGGSGTLLTYASTTAAFARDGGLPWHEKMAYVHPRLNMPIYSIGLLGVGTFLVLILALSPEASSIIYSLSVVAGLIKQIVPVFFRIFAGDRWVPGRWNMGIWSIPVHVATFISQLYLIIMECFPPYKAWDASNLNYNFAVTIGACIISCVLYWVTGRKHFKGPDPEALESWRRHHAA